MKALVALFLLSAAALADDITIHSVSRSAKEPATVLTVTFDDTAPVPSEALALDKGRWTAWCFPDESTPPALLTVVSANHRGKNNFGKNPTVVLEFESAVAQCRAVEVTLLVKTLPSQRWMKKVKADANVTGEANAALPTEASGTSLWSRLFKPPSDKGDPDYSLSGTVVAGVGTKPVYTIDGSFQTHLVSGPSTSLAMTETVKTDSSSSVDPDSFDWALTLLHVGKIWRRNIFSIKSNLSSLEFDKSSSMLNEVSSGSLMWTRDEAPRCWGVVCAIQIRVGAGVEVGDNFKNQFTIASHPGGGGSGLIVRGVPSARLAFVYPTSNPKHAIRFTSTYTLRLPLRDELFLETRLHTAAPVPLLESNPRHYLENDLTFKLTDYFAFKIQHSYGALPPTFKFTDHQISTGIVFQASQPR